MLLISEIRGQNLASLPITLRCKFTTKEHYYDLFFLPSNGKAADSSSQSRHSIVFFIYMCRVSALLLLSPLLYRFYLVIGKTYVVNAHRPHPSKQRKQQAVDHTSVAVFETRYQSLHINPNDHSLARWCALSLQNRVLTVGMSTNQSAEQPRGQSAHRSVRR